MSCLSRVDMSGYWQQFKVAGSTSARTALIEHYKYLVKKTRERIIPTVPVKILAEDVESEGQIALIKAVDYFDPGRKVRFESYAISMIRGAMLEYLRREDWAPRSVRDKERILVRAEKEFVLRHGAENLTPEALADYLEMPIDAFYQLYYAANILQVVSLEDVVGDAEHDDFDPLVVNASVSSGEPGPDVEAAKRVRRAVMAQAIGWLPSQEREVITAYYYGGKTLKQIAKDIDRSESRAHQLHAQGVQRLAGFLHGSLEDTGFTPASKTEVAYSLPRRQLYFANPVDILAERQKRHPKRRPGRPRKPKPDGVWAYDPDRGGRRVPPKKPSSVKTAVEAVG